MRLLRRNLTDFEYLPYTGEETDLNDDGEHTGEFYPAYGEPVAMRGNISAPSGKTDQTFYGTDIQYTHVLVMEDPNTAISELGLVRWRGETYEVKAVRPSLNALSVALEQQSADRMDSDDPDEPTVDPDEPSEPEVNPDEPTEGPVGETGGEPEGDGE